MHAHRSSSIRALNVCGQCAVVHLLLRYFICGVINAKIVECHLQAFMAKPCLDLSNRDTFVVMTSRPSLAPAVQVKVLPIQSGAFRNLLAPTQEVILNATDAIREDQVARLLPLAEFLHAQTNSYCVVGLEHLVRP